MYCDNAYYMLPHERIAQLLDLQQELDLNGRPALCFKGPWRHVWVELHDYPITADRAWLPAVHDYVGKMGTRLQMQAETHLDLLAFRLYLRNHIERKYLVPGENRWL